jgi:hypothetical protein
MIKLRSKEVAIAIVIIHALNSGAVRIEANPQPDPVPRTRATIVDNLFLMRVSIG